MVEREIEQLTAGPLVQLRITLSRLVWRMGPGWSVLAGALAGGAPLLTSDALLRVAAAAVLADLLWGVLRQLVPARPGAAPTPAGPPALPYGRPDAPLALFLAGLTGSSGQGLRAPWQALLIGLALAAAVSALLGPVAVLITGLALLVLLLMRGWVRRGGQPALGDAVLDVALPWLLGASLAGAAVISWQVLVLAAAFTLLHWGALRSVRLVWVGQGAVLAALVITRQPWALAAAAVLLAPPAWWLISRRVDALAYALPWWWALMLVTALASR